MEITSQAQTALHFVVVCVKKLEPSVSETVAVGFNALFWWFSQEARIPGNDQADTWVALRLISTEAIAHNYLESLQSSESRVANYVESSQSSAWARAKPRFRRVSRANPIFGRLTKSSGEN